MSSLSTTPAMFTQGKIKESMNDSTGDEKKPVLKGETGLSIVPKQQLQKFSGIARLENLKRIGIAAAAGSAALSLAKSAGRKCAGKAAVPELMKQIDVLQKKVDELESENSASAKQTDGLGVHWQRIEVFYSVIELKGSDPSDSIRSLQNPTPSTRPENPAVGGLLKLNIVSPNGRKNQSEGVHVDVIKIHGKLLQFFPILINHP